MLADKLTDLGKAEPNGDVVKGWVAFWKLLFVFFSIISIVIDHVTVYSLEYNKIISFTIMLSVPNTRRFQIKSYV